MQNKQSRTYVARRYVYAITTKAWKKRAAPVRHLLNTARYPLKIHTIETQQCIILRIHRPSKIQRATQKPYYSFMQCIRATFTNIFVTNISAPPLAAIREIIWSWKFCEYGTWNWKYSKITTDEAFWSPSCCNSWLEWFSTTCSQTLKAVIKNWYKSSNDNPDCSV